MPASGATQGDAASKSIHVRGIGVDGWDGTPEGRGAYENEDALEKIFSAFGVFVQATIRHRIADGKNTSWALVEMETTEAVDAALAAKEVMAGSQPLVLTRFSTKTAEASTGAMKQVVGHLNAHSWGRASSPGTVDKPGRHGRQGIYLGRRFRGKNALKHEIQAAVRLQRVVRGGQQRTSLREREFGRVRRLYGGLGQLPLPGAISLCRATRIDPDSRGDACVDAIDNKIKDLETLSGSMFRGVAPELRRKIMRYLHFAACVEGEVIRSPGAVASLEDALCIVLSGSVGVPAKRRRILYSDGEGRACLKLVATQEKEVLASVGETFGGLVLNNETGEIAKPQVAKDGRELTALTDCAYVVLRWQDYLLVAGKLDQGCAQVLRKTPSERSVSDVQLLLNWFKDVDAIQNVSFAPMKEQLCRHCRYRRLHNGEVLFKQGDSAESLFIVVQGYVRVIVDGENVAVLGPGASFGQNGMLGQTRSTRKRTATVMGGSVAGIPGAQHAEHLGGKRVSYCDLAEITRSTYMRVVQGSLEQTELILRKESSQRQKHELEVLVQLFAQTTFFREQLQSSLNQLKCCRVLKVRRLASRETLFAQGEHGDEFFIVVQGSLLGEVATPTSTGSGTKTFALGPGDAFGELSITGRTAEERRRTASVTCEAQECVLAVLSREDYLNATNELEAGAMEALSKAVPANNLAPAPHERSKSDINIIWSYLKDLPFFSDLRFAHLQQALCSRLQVRLTSTCPRASHLIIQI